MCKGSISAADKDSYAIVVDGAIRAGVRPRWTWVEAVKRKI